MDFVLKPFIIGRDHMLKRRWTTIEFRCDTTTTGKKAQQQVFFDKDLCRGNVGRETYLRMYHRDGGNVSSSPVIFYSVAQFLYKVQFKTASQCAFDHFLSSSYCYNV